MMWKNLFAALLVLASLGYRAFLCLRRPLVTVATAQSGDVAEVVYASGAIEPARWSEVLLLMRAPGRHSNAAPCAACQWWIGNSRPSPPMIGCA